MEKLIANELKELREKNGWSIADIAILTNVSEETVEKWEAGTEEPDLSQWIILSRFYETTTEHAFGEEAAYDFLSPEAKKHFATIINADQMLRRSYFR